MRKANKMEVRIRAMLALLPEVGKAGEKLCVFLPSRQHGGGLWSMFTCGGRKAIFMFMSGSRWVCGLCRVEFPKILSVGPLGFTILLKCFLKRCTIKTEKLYNGFENWIIPYT